VTRKVLQPVGATELRNILAEHQKWLESNGRIGTQVSLDSANVSGANLERAHLKFAKLSGCDLHSANLRFADLSGATGLLPSSLAGSDLTGALLACGHQLGLNS